MLYSKIVCVPAFLSIKELAPRPSQKYVQIMYMLLLVFVSVLYVLKACVDDDSVRFLKEHF